MQSQNLKYVTRSVTFYPDQLEKAKQEHLNLASLIRGLLDEHFNINRE